MLFLGCTLLAGCDYDQPQTPTGRLDRALKELSAARVEEERFYALDDAAKESIAQGHTREAEAYAKELLAGPMRIDPVYDHISLRQRPLSSSVLPHEP